MSFLNCLYLNFIFLNEYSFKISQRVMLGFTHQTKNTGNRWIDKEPDFQPIIITNKLPKEVSPRKEQKSIGKVTEIKKNPRTVSKQMVRPSKPKQSLNNKQQWTTGGAVRGAFDKNLRNNQLAAQQRRLRAQLKKQKQLTHQQIIIQQKKIGTKALNMMKQKDQEIEYLRQMIQKQKEQKAKIDKLYEQKKVEIERERQELIELERRIQKEGIKEKKVVEKIQRLNSPQSDGLPIKSRQNAAIQQKYISREITRQQMKKSYEQPTQSQILGQRNALRQKQLDYLIDQRQKCLKGVPNINYSPTLIPLLSKASYKIISTHVSQIVEIFIDELLQQQVHLLEQIQLEQHKQKQEQKAKQILNQYCDMVGAFVDQNDEIASKVGKYSMINFTDVYKPKHYPQQSSYKSTFQYDKPGTIILRKITLQPQFDDDRMEQIQNRKNRFVRFVSNFDQYKKPNVDMFVKCAQEIIDQAIQKLAKELDKGSGEFVDIVFRNQFK